MDSIAHQSTGVGIALFETAIGECGIAWNEEAIVGVQLPERTPRVTRDRLTRRFPHAVDAAPPSHARAAMRDIVALLAGQRPDLRSEEHTSELQSHVNLVCRLLHEIMKIYRR